MKNPMVVCQLPSAGVGFTTYNRENEGADQYGTAATIDKIVALGRAWSVLSPEVPFAVGDISRKGGGVMPPHKSHQQGVDVDLRPLRRDGQNLPTDFMSQTYSRERTRQLIETIRQVEPTATIFFNDPELIRAGLTKYLTGHHNHVHVRFAG